MGVGLGQRADSEPRNSLRPEDICEVADAVCGSARSALDCFNAQIPGKKKALTIARRRLKFVGSREALSRHRSHKS